MLRQFPFSLVLLLCVLSGGPWTAQAQRATELDPSFRFGLTNAIPVSDLVSFPDGRIGMAGSMGLNRSTMGILNGDGAVLSSERLSPATYSIAVDAERVPIFGGAGPNALLRLYGAVFDPPFILSEPVKEGVFRKILVEPETGGLIAAGNVRFFYFETNLTFGLVRYHRNGILDTNYHREDAVGLSFATAALTVDGRVLGAYSITNQSGTVSYGFGLWNTNGLRETNYSDAWMRSFASDARVTVLEPVPGTGGFLAALEFGADDSVRTRIVQLDSAGNARTDAGFPEINGRIQAIDFGVVKPATALAGSYDLVLLGGTFARVGDTVVNNLAVFDQDGTLAWAIEPGRGPDGPVTALATRLDGKILVGGAFTNFDGTATGPLVRLTAGQTGTNTFVYWADSEFRAFEKKRSASLTLYRSGNLSNTLELALEAEFTGAANARASSADFGPIPELVRFAPGEAQAVVTLQLNDDELPENRERVTIRLVSTNAEVVLTRAATTLVILDNETPGTIDPTFSTEVHPAYNGLQMWQQAHIALQPDGRILVAHQDSAGQPVITRLHPNGIKDGTFATNSIQTILYGRSQTSGFTQMKVLDDGKIYIAGRFSTTNSWGLNRLARLNSDGTIDSSFNPLLKPASGGTDDVFVFDVQADGKVMLAAYDRVSLAQYQMAPRDRQIFRLNPDGSLDDSFWPPTFYAHSDIYRATKLLVQPDGGVLVNATMGTNYGVFRFLTNGVIDANFKIIGSIEDFIISGENLILVGGFPDLNGVPAPYAARARLSDGTIDPEFSIRVDHDIKQVQSARGKLYISGYFTRVDGQDRFRFARLNADGSLDRSYDPGMGAIGWPEFVLQPDGSALLGGGYLERFDLLPASTLIRLETDPTPRPVENHIAIHLSNTELRITYVGSLLQSSTDLNHWTDVHKGGGDYTPTSEAPAQFYRSLAE